MQDALYEVTGRRTVPQVFVNGAFIGGADGALLLLLPTVLQYRPFGYHNASNCHSIASKLDATLKPERMGMQTRRQNMDPES